MEFATTYPQSCNHSSWWFYQFIHIFFQGGTTRFSCHFLRFNILNNLLTIINISSKGRGEDTTTTSYPTSFSNILNMGKRLDRNFHTIFQDSCSVLIRHIFIRFIWDRTRWTDNQGRNNRLAMVLNLYRSRITKTWCDTVGELTWRFCICSQMLRLARVATDFYFIQKERWKSTWKTSEMFSWVRGVDYEKGRY